jgi:hypothetical protein
MATKKSSGGKKSSNPAGEYIRKEMRKQKQGKRESPEQAIAIGLSKARRAGEDVPPPKKGKTSAATRKKAESDYKAGHRKRSATKKVSSAKKVGARKSTAKKSTAKNASAKK